MNVVLNEAELENYVVEQVTSGKYGSAEEVVAAALNHLIQDERIGDFAPGELDRLLEEGEADIVSGNVLSLEQAREHFHARSAEKAE